METSSTGSDLKPEKFRRDEQLPGSIEEFFEYDSLYELHEDTGYADLEQTYASAKATWGDLMWERDLEFLDLEQMPEVPVEYRDTEIRIVPVQHSGSIYDRTKARLESDKALSWKREIPTYLEQGFGKTVNKELSREMDDRDWLSEKYGVEIESIGDIEIDVGIAATVEDMEKAEQMGAAQHGLVRLA